MCYYLTSPCLALVHYYWRPCPPCVTRTSCAAAAVLCRRMLIHPNRPYQGHGCYHPSHAATAQRMARVCCIGISIPCGSSSPLQEDAVTHPNRPYQGHGCYHHIASTARALLAPVASMVLSRCHSAAYGTCCLHQGYPSLCYPHIPVRQQQSSAGGCC